MAAASDAVAGAGQASAAQDDASPMDVDGAADAAMTPPDGPAAGLRISVPSPRSTSRDPQSPRSAKAMGSPSGRKTRSGECCCASSRYASDKEIAAIVCE